MNLYLSKIWKPSGWPLKGLWTWPESVRARQLDSYPKNQAKHRRNLLHFTAWLFFHLWDVKILNMPRLPSQIFDPISPRAWCSTYLAVGYAEHSLESLMNSTISDHDFTPMGLSEVPPSRWPWIIYLAFPHLSKSSWGSIFGQKPKSCWWPTSSSGQIMSNMVGLLTQNRQHPQIHQGRTALGLGYPQEWTTNDHQDSLGFNPWCLENLQVSPQIRKKG